VSVDLPHVDYRAHESARDRGLLGCREWDIRHQLEVPSLKAVRVTMAQSAESKSGRPIPYDSRLQTAAQKSPIRRILVPIDATHVKPADLNPILKVARRFDAEITLLHCYSTPPSFGYAVGASGLADVTLHRNRIMAQLLRLCHDVQKSFAKCRCLFTFGSLPVAILRASERLQSDLIAVPLSLDFVRHCWRTKTLLDELVRRADCAVLGVPVAQGK
jgi:nucleotide-binding universal stress UspA family protein